MTGAAKLPRSCEGCGLRIRANEPDGSVTLDDGTHWHRACLAWVLSQRVKARYRRPWA